MLKITDADEIRDSPKTPIASVAQNILGVSDGGENKRFQGEEHSSDEKGRDKRAKLTTIMPEQSEHWNEQERHNFHLPAQAPQHTPHNRSPPRRPQAAH